MADDRDPSQQTEDPTQKRLDDAREHGDVVKSAELQTLILLLGSFLRRGTLSAVLTLGSLAACAGGGEHLSGAQRLVGSEGARG